MKILILSLLGVSLSLSILSQDKVNISFGQVSIADFSLPRSSVIDSNTNAVVLSEIGSTTFIGNEHHWFSYVYKKYVRIKIINEKALDASTVKFRLYGTKENKDKLSDLRADTYNVENGKVQSTSLETSDVFEDKLGSYISEIKFTLPAVRKGSILEYSYTITSNHSYNIPTWFFQNPQYPCLHSEYEVVFPAAMRYLTVRYGLDSFFVNKSSMVKNHRYNMGDLSVVSNDIRDLWIMKDIPAFTNEKYIGSPVDYLDKIEFFLAQTYNGEDLSDVGATWKGVTDQLLTDDYFGAAINTDNSTNLFNTAEKMTSGDKDFSEAARHLFYYVRDNFSCVHDDEIFIEDDLYTINKKKKGNVAEINLLLTALLRQKGIQADPVILSTREYGKNPADYPVLNKMNYVICMMRLNGDTTYLDASRPDLGFGNLSIDCFNGHARIISKNGGSIFFLPEKIKEQKNTAVIIYNNEKGQVSGSFAAAYGTFGSEKLRKEIKKSGENKYFDNLKSKLTVETAMINTTIDSLNKPEFPATVHFEFKISSTDEILYMNPVIESDYTENPFNAEQRKFPVELPYPVDDMYVLNMEIPEGYDVDELPKSAKVSLNGDEGFFEYLIGKDQNRIQFRSHIKLNDVTFAPDDYNSLRDFFAFIIKKYNEQIVFKKKK